MNEQTSTPDNQGTPEEQDQDEFKRILAAAAIASLRVVEAVDPELAARIRGRQPRGKVAKDESKQKVLDPWNSPNAAFYAAADGGVITVTNPRALFHGAQFERPWHTKFAGNMTDAEVHSGKEPGRLTREEAMVRILTRGAPALTAGTATETTEPTQPNPTTTPPEDTPTEPVPIGETDVETLTRRRRRGRRGGQKNQHPEQDQQRRGRRGGQGHQAPTQDQQENEAATQPIEEAEETEPKKLRDRIRHRGRRGGAKIQNDDQTVDEVEILGGSTATSPEPDENIVDADWWPVGKEPKVLAADQTAAPQPATGEHEQHEPELSYEESELLLHSVSDILDELQLHPDQKETIMPELEAQLAKLKKGGWIYKFIADELSNGLANHPEVVLGAPVQSLEDIKQAEYLRFTNPERVLDLKHQIEHAVRTWRLENPKADDTSVMYAHFQIHQRYLEDYFGVSDWELRRGRPGNEGPIPQEVQDQVNDMLEESDRKLKRRISEQRRQR